MVSSQPVWQENNPHPFLRISATKNRILSTFGFELKNAAIPSL
jgi:hypothetical protein